MMANGKQTKTSAKKKQRRWWNAACNSRTNRMWLDAEEDEDGGGDVGFEPQLNDDGDEGGNPHRAFVNYMRRKQASIFQQTHENVQLKSNIFASLSIYINGYTFPFPEDLCRLFVENGGEFHQYYAPGRTTYMIAENLSTETWKRIRPSEVIVKPRWIVKCLRKGKLLSVERFLLQPKIQRKIRERATRTHLPINQLTIDECLGRTRPTKVQVKTNYFRQPKRAKGSAKYLCDSKRFQRRLREQLEDEAFAEMDSNFPTTAPPSLQIRYLKKHIVEIGGVKLNFKLVPVQDRLDKIMERCRPLILCMEFCQISRSISQLEYALLEVAENAHPKWSLFVIDLKRFVNQIASDNLQAIIFCEPSDVQERVDTSDPPPTPCPQSQPQAAPWEEDAIGSVCCEHSLSDCEQDALDIAAEVFETLVAAAAKKRKRRSVDDRESPSATEKDDGKSIEEGNDNSLEWWMMSTKCSQRNDNAVDLTTLSFSHQPPILTDFH